MSCVDAAGMRAIEAAAFARGVDPGNLMDRAGEGIAHRLLDYFPTPGTAIAFIGKGNNGGDALVVLDQLQHRGWRVALRTCYPESEWTTLSRQRLRRLGNVSRDLPDYPAHPLLLLDGLLGIGAKGPLKAPLDKLAAEMNDLRQQCGAVVAAMDLPSGLDADHGEVQPLAVTADLTLTIGVPKQGLFADPASAVTGSLALVPLAELPIPHQPGLRLIAPETFPDLLPQRPHDWHKGNAGRVSLLAGSPGMSGAATLSAGAALHAGAGLVTLHSLATELPGCPPEVMVRSVGNPIEAAFDSKADALVIGPGLGELGEEQTKCLADLLGSNKKPAVLDADALNLLAATDNLQLLKPQYLITPHPGEFARLAPDLAKLPRAEAAARFVERHPCTLLLKGARTIVAATGEMIRVNPTGHSGMASGGQGDVLAGICGALLATGLQPIDAASLAAWLAGRAAERALTHGDESKESIVASDTTRHLGGAFNDWRERRR